jgi:hypothetical protein
MIDERQLMARFAEIERHLEVWLARNETELTLDAAVIWAIFEGIRVLRKRAEANNLTC